MTKSQALEHQKQVEAALVEFIRWWDEELKSNRMLVYGNAERIRHQITAWRAWLKAKGLAG